MFNQPIGSAGNGLFPANYDVRVKALEVLTKGDICQFDLALVDATSKVPGNVASPFYLVRDPDAEGTSLRTLSSYIFGVALENIAASAEGMVRVRGIVNMNVEAAVVKGSCIVPATDGRGDLATGGTNLKIIAIALEDDSVVTNFADVIFNGVEGFGNDVGSNVST
jgi:hypothetical protein